MMYDLAPGNVLQNMYLRRRLRLCLQAGQTFVELGAGNGNISRLLVEEGLTGTGYDLSEDACALNREKNADLISKGSYQVVKGDFFAHEESVDYVVTSHVIEHLPDDLLTQFFVKSSQMLKPGGRILILVPACMALWGIEDDTAGHYRRFEFTDFERIAKKHQLHIEDMAGLTYPMSNLILGLSNHLVRKNDSWKKELSMQERTLVSSAGASKKVMFKSVFPWYFRYLVNEITMYPWDLLQRLFRNNERLMIIYCELTLRHSKKETKERKS